MPRILTDATKSLLAPVARSKASGDGSDTEDSVTFYVSEQPVLLTVLEELRDNDVGGA